MRQHARALGACELAEGFRLCVERGEFGAPCLRLRDQRRQLLFGLDGHVDRLAQLDRAIERRAQPPVVLRLRHGSRVGRPQFVLSRIGKRDLGSKQLVLRHQLALEHAAGVAHQAFERVHIAAGNRVRLARAQHTDVGIGHRQLEVGRGRRNVRARAPFARFRGSDAR